WRLTSGFLWRDRETAPPSWIYLSLRRWTVGGRTRRAAKRGSASIFEIDARHRSWTTDLSSEEEVRSEASKPEVMNLTKNAPKGEKCWSRAPLLP
ncbi:unnamed protein product, partial [Brassica rapa]